MEQSLPLGCVGSQSVPRCFAGHIDLLDPHVTGTGPENGDDLRVLGTDVEGGMYNPGWHEDTVAGLAARTPRATQS